MSFDKGDGILRCLTIVAALVLLLVCVSPARAERPPNCSKKSARAELRCAKRQLAQARRELAAPFVSPPHSRGYWAWRVKVARRWIREARYRLAHPPIPHLALWTCIHGYEGAWDSNTGNGYYGGLQMTSPWGKGVYYVFRADLLSPYMQMRKAELGYAASGYSRAWLLGQWAHPSCFGFA